MKCYLVIFCILICIVTNAQTEILSGGRTVSCILPGSICVITDTKSGSDKHLIGSKIEVFTASYSLSESWYSGGAAAFVEGGKELEINSFRFRVISQPALPSFPLCQPGAETPAGSFGFAADVNIQILALGAMDMQRYQDAGKYIGEVYKTSSRVTPIGGCWYSGILQKGNRIFLFPCMQVKMVGENEKPAIPTLLPNQPGANSPSISGKLTDPRDGEATYKTVNINNQTWMAENLDAMTFRNGDRIPGAKSAKEWKKAGAEGRPAWCYYNFNPENDDHGKLYNWYAVNDPRGLAPEGWHVPADEEWTRLINYIEGGKGTALKLRATTGWSLNAPGSNETGFAGLPGGFCTNNGIFSGVGGHAGRWSATSYSGDAAWKRCIYYTQVYKSKNVLKVYVNKADGVSVRCVKD